MWNKIDKYPKNLEIYQTTMFVKSIFFCNYTFICIIVETLNNCKYLIILLDLKLLKFKLWFSWAWKIKIFHFNVFSYSIINQKSLSVWTLNFQQLFTLSVLSTVLYNQHNTYFWLFINILYFWILQL